MTPGGAFRQGRACTSTPPGHPQRAPARGRRLRRSERAGATARFPHYRCSATTKTGLCSRRRVLLGTVAYLSMMTFSPPPLLLRPAPCRVGPGRWPRREPSRGRNKINSAHSTEYVVFQGTRATVRARCASLNPEGPDHYDSGPLFAKNGEGTDICNKKTQWSPICQKPPGRAWQGGYAEQRLAI